MYCQSCGASLARGDAFCPKCGTLVAGQQGEAEAVQDAATLTPATPKPYDPYVAQSPTFYGSQTTIEGMQNPYAPLTPPPPPPSPKRRRTPPGFFKGFFTGVVIILLLGGGLGAVLILKLGAQSHSAVGSVATPRPTVRPRTTPQPTAPNGQSCTLAQNCEAENASLSGGEAVHSDHMNYSGTGFAADYGVQGATTTWTLNNVPASANDMLTIRYANSTAGDGQTITRTFSLSINGSKTGQVAFPITASWDTWGLVQQTIHLNSGTDTIALACDPGDSCNLNIDWISVR